MGNAAAAFSDQIAALQTDNDNAIRSAATEALESLRDGSTTPSDAALVAAIHAPTAAPELSAPQFAVLLDAPDNSVPPVRPTAFKYSTPTETWPAIWTYKHGC
jgi:hypothetical protein